MLKIFISSVQKEFARERKALQTYLQGDALLCRFFEVFLFEDVPAADHRADEIYLDKVRQCDLYIGLLGNEYGYEDAEGVSPTEREFDQATLARKHRLIFVKGMDDSARHPKMQQFIHKVSDQLIRRRFNDKAELIASVYAALVNYLEDGGFIRNGPFDATFCRNAVIDDLDEEKISYFLRRARRARAFALDENADPREVLIHLSLLDGEHPTNAAMLLFGKTPQRFLPTSEIKCAHFHGIDVAKPIPSHQVYKGTVFELVDQAVDFVMSKINLWVGTRAQSVQAPVQYEIPREVVSEAIVNAVAHRDYTSTGSVQVMLFADRLEVWNPGDLPAALTLAMLKKPHGSFPANPLIAEPLYLTQYIERMGTGTRDMVTRCHAANLPAPEFTLTDGFKVVIRRDLHGDLHGDLGGNTLQVSDAPEERLLLVLEGEMSRQELQNALSLKNTDYFRLTYIIPALEKGYIEMTLPDKPNSRLQKYRLTNKGKKRLKREV